MVTKDVACSGWVEMARRHAGLSIAMRAILMRTVALKFLKIST
jgi:hypothetical protein